MMVNIVIMVKRRFTRGPLKWKAETDLMKSDVDQPKLD